MAPFLGTPSNTFDISVLSDKSHARMLLRLHLSRMNALGVHSFIFTWLLYHRGGDGLRALPERGGHFYSIKHNIAKQPNP